MKAKKKSIYREKIHGVEVRDLGDEHFLGGLNQQGLFATKTFYEYDIIGEYAGRVVPSLVKGKYVACLESKHFEDSLGVEALEIGNEMRFINSYQNIDFLPNVKMKIAFIDGLPRVLIVVIKQIEIGSEILLDYGEDYNFEG